MNEQSHYKQDKTKRRQSINVKSHILNVRGDNDKTKQPPTRMLSVVQECQHKYQVLHIKEDHNNRGDQQIEYVMLNASPLKHVKRGWDTKIPQSSGPPVKVGDGTIHKELGDRMERAATTASSLEAEQES
ncbi:hypothetical protein Tco_0743077, partial [Tanacetum coccineum]